jgi:hypothetical protein
MKDQEISDFARKLLVSRYSILHYYSDMDIAHMLPSIQEIRDANSDAKKMEAVIHKFILFLNFLRKKAEGLKNEAQQKEMIFPAEDVLAWLLKILDLEPIYVATQ